MKKVLIVNKYFYHIGGVEEVVRSLAEIDDEDIKIKVLACKSPQSFNAGKKYPSKVVTIRPLITLFKTPLSFRFALILIRDYFKSDIIHLHSPYPFAEVIVSILSLLKKKKIIITYHAEIVKQKIIFRLLYLFWRNLFKKSAAIIITSPYLKNAPLLKSLGIKIRIIPIGIKDNFKNFKRDYTEMGYVISVGRLVYYKGIDILISAISESNLKLKIIGSGPLEEYLYNQIKRLGIEDRVEILTKVGDVDLIEYYKKASIFVLSSVEKTEAFGIVQVLAMSSGLPVINTDLKTGVAWVARNGFEGITVAPKNITELSVAIWKLENDTSLREILGRGGRKRFEEMFSFEKMLNSHKELYKNI